MGIKIANYSNMHHYVELSIGRVCAQKYRTATNWNFSPISIARPICMCWERVGPVYMDSGWVDLVKCWYRIPAHLGLDFIFLIKFIVYMIFFAFKFLWALNFGLIFLQFKFISFLYVLYSLIIQLYFIPFYQFFILGQIYVFRRLNCVFSLYKTRIACIRARRSDSTIC